MTVTKQYFSADVYDGLLFKNRKGEGEIYKVTLNGDENVTLIGITTSYDNKHYPMKTLLELLNKGEYVEESTEPSINNSYSIT